MTQPAPIPPRPGAEGVSARLAEILRVDHAGELGAVHIYRGQRAVFEGSRAHRPSAAAWPSWRPMKRATSPASTPC